jgi:uncharacterized membrane protein
VSTGAAADRRERFVAIDVMRGLVMMLMTIDHASGELNAGRLITDSIYFWKPGTPLPTAQFMTRWVTHLCAPPFVFLAGASLAISAESRRAAGNSARSIDVHIAKRGALLIAFEILWMSWVMRSFGDFLFQVLYALGASLLAMIALRRLGDRALVTFAIAWIAVGEAVVGLLTSAGLRETLLSGLLVSGGFFANRRLIVAYPAIPWLAMMALGWAFGRRLLFWRDGGRDVGATASRVLLPAGLAGIAAFVVLRGIDGYGNMLLHREDASLVQWLHVSKYPPSATFTCLELGIMAVVLALLFRFGSGRPPPRSGGVLRTIGQTALFYYLLHIHVLALGAWMFGVREKLGLWSAYAGAAAVLVLLYPACVRYRRFKAERPTSFAQYI